MEYNTETEIRICAIQIFDPSLNKKNNPIGPVVCTWFTNRRHSSFIILYWHDYRHNRSKVSWSRVNDIVETQKQLFNIDTQADSW